MTTTFLKVTNENLTIDKNVPSRTIISFVSHPRTILLPLLYRSQTLLVVHFVKLVKYQLFKRVFPGSFEFPGWTSFEENNFDFKEKCH